MDSTKVIKVKHGDTLRRFSAHVDESENLDLDMERLRAKVVSLFNFSHDADFTLTYIDEDGDVVTLVDDDDLRDAVRQNLNPLRINVLTDTERAGRSYASSRGSSTPMKPPQVQNSLPGVTAGVAEVLKSVPDPLREALSKISLDLTSKAASSAPLFSELVESFSRIGQSYLNRNPQFQFGVDAGTQRETSQSPVSQFVAKDPGASEDKRSGPVTEVLSDAKQVQSASKNVPEADIKNVTRGVGVSVIPLPASMDLNLPGDSTQPGHTTVNVSQFTSAPCSEKRNENGSKANPTGKTIDFGTCVTSDGHCSTHSYTNAFNECPFTGVPLVNDSTVRPISCRRYRPFKRGHIHGDNIHIFHRGVRCDGCGVHPITGPRYKSKVKEDYDLCNVCFAEMGNEADYIRMDRPASYFQPWPSKGFYDPMQQPSICPPAPPHPLRGRMKPTRPKLDSRFIEDVNVMDGTMTAPSTQFTKIWRMRNNGTVVWPHGTQLVWIGGDRFSLGDSVQIEAPVNGVPVDTELDIAVDFKAPELPGRYISYWKMSLPSGQKFGQRVWVLIQVMSSKDPLTDSFHGLNLNLPPDSCGSKGAEFIDVNVRPLVDGSVPDPWNPRTAAESVEQMVSKQPIKDQELNFPINDTLLVGSGVPVTAPPKVPSSVSYPVVDFPDIPPVAPSYEPSLVKEALNSSGKVGENTDVEQTLLKELEEMGFKQVDLNKEILRMNEYNLEQSVDDLCGVAEWDPILEELEDMGFNDKEMNKKLLKNHNGSIKRVVMDLIAGEKTSGKEKTQ